MQLKGKYKSILGSVEATVAGIALSVAFKLLLGAPNYGLGIVVAVTAVCYLYGLAAALSSLVVMISGVYALSVEASFGASIPRLLTITITSALTCYLAVRLRASVNKLAEVLERERRIAITMQRAFMPRIPERLGNVSIESFYEPGSDEADIGGDFIDVFELQNGFISIALGDVSGKGVDAARQAVIAQCGLRTYARESSSPDEALTRLNSMLADDLRFGGFVTLFHAVLDQSIGHLTYVTGGHEPPVIYRAGLRAAEMLLPNGQLLGAVANVEESCNTLTMGTGDFIFVYSDGLSEAKLADGSIIGSEKIAQILALRAGSGDLHTVVRNTVEEIRSLAGGRFRDDVAVIAVRLD